jgi:hypothetical protein
VIDLYPPLAHHLFHLAIADGIEAVPPHAEEDDFRQKVTPFERGFGSHAG